MTWKKTWISYFLWGLLSILICIAFFAFGNLAVNQMNLNIYWLFLPIVGVVLVYICIKLCKKKWNHFMLSETLAVTLESLVFIAFIGFGLLIRLYAVSDISDSELFQYVKISNNALELQPTHGALGLYISLFQMLFYFLGNSWVSAVALQLILQLISFIVFYFVIRKTTGVISAIVAFALLMFAPMNIQMGVTLQPAVFYFLLCCLVLYFLSESTKRIHENGKVKFYQYITAILVGLLSGLIIYLDLIGVFLFFIGIAFYFLHDKNNMECKIRFKALYYALYVTGVLLGLVGALFISAGFKLENIFSVMLKWEELYMPTYGASLYFLPNNMLTTTDFIYTCSLFALLLLGILIFWESKKTAPAIGWSIVVLLLLLMQYNCPAIAFMPRNYFLHIFVTVFASSGLQAIFVDETQMISEIQEVNESQMSNEIQEANEIQEENVGLVEDVPKQEIHYIPNPLPLPKKHVKKTMGYGVEVEGEKMCFDLDIEEDDDFDL